jgi:hypothetical protein
MIADSFDSRIFANMEVALERACRVFAIGSEKHAARRHIASKILECAQDGDKTLGGLTKAGRAAATELCTAHKVRAFVLETVDTLMANSLLTPSSR